MARTRRKLADPGQASGDRQELSGQQLATLVKRAEDGDEDAFAQLRPIFARDQAFWRRLAAKSVNSEVAWINRLVGQQLVTREMLQQQLAAMRTDLEGPQPTPLERLLVERIVACWLQVQFFELRFAKPSEGWTWPHWEHYEKSLDRAQRRLLDAIRTLGQVRRLALPALQLNVARNQINQLNVPPVSESPRELPPETE